MLLTCLGTRGLKHHGMTRTGFRFTGLGSIGNLGYCLSHAASASGFKYGSLHTWRCKASRTVGTELRLAHWVFEGRITTGFSDPLGPSLPVFLAVQCNLHLTTLDLTTSSS